MDYTAIEALALILMAAASVAGLVWSRKRDETPPPWRALFTFVLVVSFIGMAGWSDKVRHEQLEARIELLEWQVGITETEE